MIMPLNSVGFAWPEGRLGAVTSSWDDGTVHDRRLVEILNQYGLKATFNLNSGKLVHGEPIAGKTSSRRPSPERPPSGRGPEPARQGRPRITRDEVASLYRGHEVAVHTVTHPHLDRIPPQAVLTEIIEDRRALEQLVGYPVTGMALPFGTYTDRVLEIAAAAGIRYCRPVATRRDFAPPGDPLRWQPTTHHKGDLLELWTAFTESTREDKLFFWWGHSYEFAGDDNWELLEEFGTAVTGISNLWHATNMEIIEYLEAYRNLEFAVELSSLRNRSGIPVWLRINNELQRITPGTTLQLAGPETLE